MDPAKPNSIAWPVEELTEPGKIEVIQRLLNTLPIELWPKFLRAEDSRISHSAMTCLVYCRPDRIGIDFDKDTQGLIHMKVWDKNVPASELIVTGFEFESVFLDTIKCLFDLAIPKDENSINLARHTQVVLDEKDREINHLKTLMNAIEIIAEGKPDGMNGILLDVVDGKLQSETLEAVMKLRKTVLELEDKLAEARPDHSKDVGDL
jgi:hypothetical protein